MRWSRRRRKPARYPALPAVALVATLGLALGACSTDQSPTVSLAAARGGTIAFDSIEGPPTGVFQKLVDSLASEAETRQLAFVSRQDPAQYRVRGYVSAHVEKKRTTISWVWDVYDANQERTLRLTGEQTSDGNAGWRAADDRLIRQMAHDGMDKLAAYFAAPEPAPAPPRAAPDTSQEIAVSPPASEPATRVAAFTPVPAEPR
jgi:hypothetical protein